MPEPLLIPPSVTVFPPSSKETAYSLLTVSVVIIAILALVPFSREESSFPHILFTPFTSLSTGSCIPITPVEPTAIESTGTPKLSLIAFAVASHASKPSLPVQAFAIPVFITIPCMGLSDFTSFISHCTQAALTTLLVKVPALTQGVSEKTIAMSFLLAYFTPASVYAALKPFAAVIPPAIILMSDMIISLWSQAA